MAKDIPEYELYGDLLVFSAPDSIHLEPIRERSVKHDWTIRAHRHRRLGQLFLFRTPGVKLSLGEVELCTTQPTILVAAPGQVHGFRFPEDVVGDVLSVRMSEMPPRLQELFGRFQEPTRAIFPEQEIKQFDVIAALFGQLEKIYRSTSRNRSDIMFALVDLILLYLAEEQHSSLATLSKQSANGRGRQHQQAEAFCTELEKCFDQPLSVAEYGDRIGLSAPHLTRICRDVLGAPPNALVRQRRMLEAKRLLEYSTLSINDIALRCGFKDPGFFSRAFKSQVGITANAYRAKLDQN